LPLYGHSVGHTGFLIGSKLLLWGDIVHNVYLQLEHPNWQLSFDTDRQLGVKSRLDILDRASKNQYVIGGGHLPYPGFGFVEKSKQNYHWKTFLS